MTELDRRYRAVLYRGGMNYTPLVIPYLNTPESKATLEAEIRLYAHDQRMWDMAPALFYRHLLRAGLTAQQVGAIVGRSAHTIHTGSATHRQSMTTTLRVCRDAQIKHGFMNVSVEDLAIVEQQLNHMDTQRLHAKGVDLTLNPRLFI